MNKQNKIFYNNEMLNKNRHTKKIKKLTKNDNTNDKDKYIKLMNDFYDSNLNINDFTDDDFNEVIHDFQNDLKDSGYDGNGDLDNIYWFIKGLKLPPRHFVLRVPLDKLPLKIFLFVLPSQVYHLSFFFLAR